MWSSIVAIAALVAVGLAKQVPTCQYGEWSSCGGETCASNFKKGRMESFELTATKFDAGRQYMKMMTKEKLKSAAERVSCRKDGTCPELMGQAPTDGPRKCIDGAAGTIPGSSSPLACHNIDQLSFLSLDALDMDHDDAYNRESNDIWGWTDPDNGEEYVIHCMTTGTSFVRISPDPENPTVVAFLPTHTSTSSWRDAKVINNHAYIGSEASGHGMQVFDLTRLRGQESLGVVSHDFHYNKVGNSHNIISNEETNTIFIVGASGSYWSDYISCSSGLHMVDVSDPKQPVFAGCYSEDGYTHDAQCVIYRGPDGRYTGREICFNYNEDSLTIVDVTDRSNPVMVSKMGYDLSKYTHQGWLTEDQTMLLLDDEQDEYYEKNGDQNTYTYLWDVKDLRNPVWRDTFISTQQSIDHNQYIKGDWTYQSNYEAGLRILRIDQRGFQLTETGFFDVLSDVDDGRVRYSGSWSNYPYFDSGVIAMTSIEYGLYLVKPDMERMEAEYFMQQNGLQSRDSRDPMCPTQTRACPAPRCY
ncbi:unnamed protein product [Owenia fusiformis]|uniref:Uncharacterized protein n=1 Tax=Owenia fusiformis TaxID=6347 RepID=A0A8J1Y220_OWEFU|nr:unnamed protein product [Owenia fusiformis]